MMDEERLVSIGFVMVVIGLCIAIPSTILGFFFNWIGIYITAIIGLVILASALAPMTIALVLVTDVKDSLRSTLRKALGKE